MGRKCVQLILEWIRGTQHKENENLIYRLGHNCEPAEICRVGVSVFCKTLLHGKKSDFSTAIAEFLPWNRILQNRKHKSDKSQRSTVLGQSVFKKTVIPTDKRIHSEFTLKWTIYVKKLKSSDQTGQPTREIIGISIILQNERIFVEVEALGVGNPCILQNCI